MAILPPDHADRIALAHEVHARPPEPLETPSRATYVAVLMAPDFAYRLDRLETSKAIHALSDVELASRLSYFLWSSQPDEELRTVASSGALLDADVLAAVHLAHAPATDERRDLVLAVDDLTGERHGVGASRRRVHSEPNTLLALG